MDPASAIVGEGFSVHHSLNGVPELVHRSTSAPQARARHSTGSDRHAFSVSSTNRKLAPVDLVSAQTTIALAIDQNFAFPCLEEEEEEKLELPL